MRYLLDTHTLLWFLQDDPQLPKKVSNEITNTDNTCYVSIASLWEIAIKINLGKLSIKFPFVQFVSYLAENDIEVLQIGFDHLVKVATLDLHHRDPFDRIIIA
jgi:PIN domain nuclease of toxin-antitoxin system